MFDLIYKLYIEGKKANCWKQWCNPHPLCTGYRLQYVLIYETLLDTPPQGCASVAVRPLAAGNFVLPGDGGRVNLDRQQNRDDDENKLKGLGVREPWCGSRRRPGSWIAPCSSARGGRGALSAKSHEKGGGWRLFAPLKFG